MIEMEHILYSIHVDSHIARAEPWKLVALQNFEPDVKENNPGLALVLWVMIEAI